MSKLPTVQARPIDFNWRPSDEVIQLLGKHSITRKFAEDQLPEFILYWSERGSIEHSWGAKFVKHCVREWRRFEIQQARASRDIAMHTNWQPSQKARSALRASGMSDEFINDCLDDFVLYWIERGDIGHVWNSRFVQHVRYRWAHRPATKQSIHRSLQEDLTDRSWTIGLTGGEYGKDQN